MKRKSIKMLLCLLAIILLPLLALADSGPKPSVQVELRGIEENVCYYVTLLSKTPSTEPASVYNGENAYGYEHYSEEERTVWEKMVQYRDPDGYYFLQVFSKCCGNDSFRWGYYPPAEFKILLYFPAEDTFAVSERYERYAFDSYYTADLSSYELPSGQPFTVARSYDYAWELFSLLARIVITVLAELTLAWLIGFRAKKSLGFIAVVNVITQTLLNILLNVINYYEGWIMFIFNYIWLELLVAALEAAAYLLWMRKFSDQAVRSGKIVGYALGANALSFAVGMLLARIIPGIF